MYIIRLQSAIAQKIFLTIILAITLACNQSVRRKSFHFSDVIGDSTVYAGHQKVSLKVPFAIEENLTSRKERHFDTTFIDTIYVVRINDSYIKFCVNSVDLAEFYKDGKISFVNRFEKYEIGSVDTFSTVFKSRKPRGVDMEFVFRFLGNDSLFFTERSLEGISAPAHSSMEITCEFVGKKVNF